MLPGRIHRSTSSLLLPGPASGNQHFSTIGWAGWLLTGFFVLNCLVLIIVVLLQSGKAADLAGAFGGAGSQTAFGPRGAATVLSQATTWCAVIFMVTSITLSVMASRKGGNGSVLQNYKTSAPANTPAKPAQK